MSGGSMDYFFCKVAEAEFRDDTPLRRAFREHLKKIAKALHDIEWVDSGDYGPGGEDAAIRACITPQEELVSALAEARRALAALNAAIKVAEG